MLCVHLAVKYDVCLAKFCEEYPVDDAKFWKKEKKLSYEF